MAELLQTLDIGRKTACIHLKEVGGSICVKEGHIVYAGFRDFTGRDAVTRLLFLEKGTFSREFRATAGRDTACPYADTEDHL